MNLNGLPRKEKTPILYKKIRDYHKRGWSYAEISRFFNVSKTTVFVALKGRKKKLSL